MASNLVLVRFIKILHTLGSLGLMGGVAVFLVLRSLHAEPGTTEYGAICRGVIASYRYVVTPSMLLCVLSGFASMFAHRPYWNALWAWLKGGLGIAVLNFTFRMHVLAQRVADPAEWADRSSLAELFRAERLGLWILLALAVVNVVVGIWRPRFKRLTGGR